MATALVKILGETDDVTTCWCCGREGLKATVVAEDELSEIVYYGRVCAAKLYKPAQHLSTEKAVKKLDKAIIEAQQRNREAAIHSLFKHPLFQAGQRFLNRSRLKMLNGADYADWKADEATGKTKQQQAIAEVSAKFMVNLSQYVTIAPGRPLEL